MREAEVIMARVIVEQVFAEPLTEERAAQIAGQLDPCIELRHGAWRRSSLSKDRLRMVCEFEAPDAESVREAFRSAGVPYERAWAASVYAVEDYPDKARMLAELLERKKNKS
jgi:hypothetical protein